MKWFPPHIERCRWLRRQLLNTRCVLLLATAAGLLSGCSSLPQMRSLPASTVASDRPANSLPPDFDIQATETIGQTARSSGITAPAPVAAQPDPSPAKTSPESTVAITPVPETINTQPSNTPDSVQSVNEVAKAETGKPELAKATTSPQSPDPAPLQQTSPKTELARANSAKSDTPTVATNKPSGVLVTPPKPFDWERSGESAGGRPFLTTSPGDEGYRTLVVGSVGGNDPIALELIDLLAKRLHEDSVILGGFDCTIIRTLNPDGEANRKFLNQRGQYINEGFPKVGDKPANDQPAEVTYLLQQIQKLQPQRVVHVRTVKGETGIIAASDSCQSTGKEVAEWLNFKLITLSQNAHSAGSIERYVSTSGSSDMITFGIPNSTTKEELWTRYGDTLLNLLLRDDVATREMARQQSQKSSADRRNQSPDK